jgi:hypothetical protein
LRQRRRQEAHVLRQAIQARTQARNHVHRLNHRNLKYINLEVKNILGKSAQGMGADTVFNICVVLGCSYFGRTFSPIVFTFRRLI